MSALGNISLKTALDLPWWMKLAAGAALLAALYGAFAIWRHSIYQEGWDVRDRAAKEEKRQVNAAAEKKFSEAREKALAAQTLLQDQLYALDTHRTQELADHEKIVDVLQSRVRAGTERLSVAVRRQCPVPAGGPGQDPTIAPGPGTETRADLLPESAARIVRIAADGAQLVHDYNALVDVYNAARATCNGD